MTDANISIQHAHIVVKLTWSAINTPDVKLANANDSLSQVSPFSCVCVFISF